MRVLKGKLKVSVVRSALGAYGYVIPSSAHTRWTELNDDQLTVNNVQDVLKAISDDVWVSAACTDRLVDDLSVQRATLDIGIERSHSASSNTPKRCP